MRLTSYTDYALRALIYLAVKDDLATITEIAERYAISRNHLVKIVHDLGRRGYLRTVRGKHGGIRLARRPPEINLGQVVRDMEPDMALVECFDAGSGGCRIESACVLRRSLDRALDAFLRELDGYTLADLAHPRHALGRALALEVRPRAGLSAGARRQRGGS